MNRPVIIFCGDSWVRSWTIRVDGVVLNLTGASAKLHVRPSFSSTDLSLELGTTPLTGITIASPTSGIVLLKSAPIELPVGRYVFDLQITLADGTVQTYEQNRLIVRQDVTR